LGIGLSERFDLWIKNLKPETGKVYGRYHHRLFKGAKKEPNGILELLKLPLQKRDRTASESNVETPSLVKPGTNPTWNHALVISSAASKPHDSHRRV